MTFTINCVRCPESFTAAKISDAMTARRVHEEQRHRHARVETDTSLQS